jgi:hypothetical protein
MVTGKHVIIDDVFFELIHTNPGSPIGIEIWFDQQCLLDQNYVDNHLEFHHKFQNNSQPHRLRIVVKNKTRLQTVLSSDNHIVTDTAVKIQNFRLNDILMIDVFYTLANYQREKLDTIPLMECFGYLGFNGQVIFDFDSPVDDWAIKHYI